jgi:predicted O-methyltransferase YrrM
VIRYEQEIDSEFWESIENELKSLGRPIGTVGFPEVLYCIVRHIKPEIVVETGVGAGLSTGFMLKALETNGAGRLFSIDLPNHELVLSREGRIPIAIAILPEGKKPGFLVPQSLRQRWVIRTGKTQNLLPQLLRELARVDIFFHDSEHTFENMLFEYDASWPYIREGGLLLSDNVNDNNAFFEFARKVRRNFSHFPISTLGGIRK